MLTAALAGDAQPRVLPPVVVVSFSNIYEFAGQEFFLNARIKDLSRSVEIQTFSDDADDDVEVAADSASYSVRLAVYHMANSSAEDGAKLSTRRTSGHYKCAFRELTRWYSADDSAVREIDAPPRIFPTVVFLERTSAFKQDLLLPHAAPTSSEQEVRKRPAMAAVAAASSEQEVKKLAERQAAGRAES